MTEHSLPPMSDSAALLFETWLQTDLQRLYDRALHEPLPDDLLRLIPQGHGHDTREH